ncbi:MAG: carbohydrate kinase family protein [Gaiellaceae bacterium]
MPSPPDVVCLGILVADAVARPVDAPPLRGKLSVVDELTLHGGGCALNTASGLARLGLRVEVAGKVGADPFGDFLLDLLDSRGIGRSGVIRDPESATSASVVLVSSDAERSFIHCPGASGDLRAEELDPAGLSAGRALHVAGSLVMERLDGEPTGRILAEARARGAHTSLDTVFDPTGRWERVLPSLQHADLVCVSLSEAQAITGERDPALASEWLRRRGAGDVAVKLGPGGCFVAGEGFEGQVQPLVVEAVDGTGAGDAFVAGLLYGRLAGWPLERSARLANAVGALATTVVGASESPPTLAEALAAAGLE